VEVLSLQWWRMEKVYILIKLTCVFHWLVFANWQVVAKGGAFMAVIVWWLATGQWFSLCPPVSSTNKTDRHNITEIVLKVALNTNKQTRVLVFYFNLFPLFILIRMSINTIWLKLNHACLRNNVQCWLSVLKIFMTSQLSMRLQSHGQYFMAFWGFGL
jgi:hypothetical protein